jgi:hypothetical protein
MTRSPANAAIEMDVAQVIRFHAEQRRVAATVDHVICGDLISFERRRSVRVCALERHHVGGHV